jgi:DNA-directed RNA polymerase subunit K/omega
VILHPPGIGAYEFVVLASLRVGQLTRGCRPRIDGAHKNTVIAQLEVSQGKVVQAAVTPALVGDTFVAV